MNNNSKENQATQAGYILFVLLMFVVDDYLSILCSGSEEKSTALTLQR